MTRSTVRGAAVLSALLVVTLGGLTGVAAADHGSRQLDVCCAWNAQLADGILTYRISGGDASAQATVRGAVEDWDGSVPGLTLTEVFGRASADIGIKFKKGGGSVAGQALRKFDRGGFIESVSLTISGSGFGLPNNAQTVAEITRHETGHALGLGHANFDDLMDPTVGGASAISACDVQGVEAANHWKLVDGANEPHHPHVTHLAC